ncbi:hypothetical protein DFH28DRAFT_931629 [Melampsora americana]|nr:hypothetical protein DFH28DRAFT_931629 [Melampsora americana]
MSGMSAETTFHQRQPSTSILPGGQQSTSLPPSDKPSGVMGEDKAECVQDEIRRIREESAEGLARAAADTDDLRCEMSDIKKLLEQLVARQETPSARSATPTPGEMAQPVATSKPAAGLGVPVHPPQPEWTEGVPEARTVEHPQPDSFASVNPFNQFASPPGVPQPGQHFVYPAAPMALNGGVPFVPPYWTYPPQTPEREVLAKHLKDSEIPQFTCGYGDIVGLRLWRYRMEAKFKVKGLDSEVERLKVLPAALAVPHAVQWHRTHAAELEGKSWAEAMVMFQDGMLPAGWLRDVKQSQRDLAQKPGEDMSSYIIRARGIQDMLKTSVCSDQDLAERIVAGTSVLFREAAAKDELIDKALDDCMGTWSFSLFEK